MGIGPASSHNTYRTNQQTTERSKTSTPLSDLIKQGSTSLKKSFDKIGCEKMVTLMLEKVDVSNVRNSERDIDLAVKTLFKDWMINISETKANNLQNEQSVKKEDFYSLYSGINNEVTLTFQPILLPIITRQLQQKLNT